MDMEEGLPFPVPSVPVPVSESESRKDEESFHDRIARLRRIREAAAERVARRYADIEPEKGKWRAGDAKDLITDRPQVL